MRSTHSSLYAQICQTLLDIHVIVGAEDEMASLREAQAAQRGGTQQSADEAAAVLKAAKESRAPRRRRSAKKGFQSP